MELLAKTHFRVYLYQMIAPAKHTQKHNCAYVLSVCLRIAGPL